MIVADTEKGKYFTEVIEGKLNWHGKALGYKTEEVVNNLKSLMKSTEIEYTTFKPEGE